MGLGSAVSPAAKHFRAIFSTNLRFLRARIDAIFPFRVSYGYRPNFIFFRGGAGHSGYVYSKEILLIIGPECYYL